MVQKSCQPVEVGSLCPLFTKGFSTTPGGSLGFLKHQAIMSYGEPPGDQPPLLGLSWDVVFSQTSRGGIKTSNMLAIIRYSIRWWNQHQWFNKYGWKIVGQPEASCIFVSPWHILEHFVIKRYISKQQHPSIKFPSHPPSFPPRNVGRSKAGAAITVCPGLGASLAPLGR